MDLKQHLIGLSGPGSNKKAGFLCPYTVEELIDASDMVPVRLIPQNPDVDIADAYLPNNLCSYLRHAVDMALKGRLEGYRCIVAAHSCDGARRAYDVLNEHLRGVEIHFLDVPKKTGGHSATYFKKQLKDLKAFLEKAGGFEISETALLESVKKYNLNRELFTELYRLRVTNPSFFGSGFMGDLLEANASNPKSEMNSRLKALIEDIKHLSTELNQFGHN